MTLDDTTGSDAAFTGTVTRTVHEARLVAVKNVSLIECYLSVEDAAVTEKVLLHGRVAAEVSSEKWHKLSRLVDDTVDGAA